MTSRQGAGFGLRSDGMAGDRWAYRSDVEGLRAVAILLVVSYHIWFGRVSGGVDVFLMLSAFFLTRSFVRGMVDGSPVSQSRRLLGTFRRLVPTAAATLILVLVTVRLVYPSTMWQTIWEQTWASLFYAQNWLLAVDAVDYYARSQTLSPLQHFWSLSVQGQAFVIWAALLAVCALIARKSGRSADWAVAVVFGSVFMVSLAYSIARTASAQQTAYFDTGARLWEFAAGSLLVVLLPHVKLGKIASAIVGWTGLGALVLCGVVLDVQGGFPGYLALWPVLSAAAIVLSGNRADSAGPARLLRSRPLQLVGRDAYALYLVHWPVLVTWMVLQGRSEVGFAGGVFLIGLSLVLARILTAAVDQPLRTWRRRDARTRVPIAVIAASATVVGAPVMIWQTATERRAEVIAEAAVTANPGALVLLRDDVVESAADAQMVPLPSELDNEWVQLDRECAGRLASTDDLLAGSCFQTPNANRTSQVVIVIGDSHAQQMTGALLPVAEENGWGVVSLIRGGCAMGLDEMGGDGCVEWREAAIAHVERIAPDALMTIVTRADPGDDDEQLRPGIEGFIDRIDAAGIPIVAVRDNPRFDYDMFGCIVDAEDPQECAMPRSGSLSHSNPALVLQRESITHVDLTEWICPYDICEPVIGNVAVFKDDNHLTATYARTLAPALAGQLISRTQ